MHRNGLPVSLHLELKHLCISSRRLISLKIGIAVKLLHRENMAAYQMLIHSRFRFCFISVLSVRQVPHANGHIAYSI